MIIVVDSVDMLAGISTVKKYGVDVLLFDEFMSSNSSVRKKLGLKRNFDGVIVYVITSKLNLVKRILGLVKSMSYKRTVLVAFPEVPDVVSAIVSIGNTYLDSLVNASIDVMSAIIKIMPGAPDIIKEYWSDMVRYIVNTGEHSYSRVSVAFKNRFFLELSDVVGKVHNVDGIYYITEGRSIRRVCNFKIYMASRVLVDSSKRYYKVTLYTDKYEVSIYPWDRKYSLELRYPGIKISSKVDLYDVLGVSKDIKWKQEVPSGFKNGVFYLPGYIGDQFATPSLSWVVVEKSTSILTILDDLWSNRKLIRVAQDILDYLSGKKFFTFHTPRADRMVVIKKALEIIGIETPIVISKKEENECSGNSISTFFPRLLVLGEAGEDNINAARMSLSSANTYEFPMLIVTTGRKISKYDKIVPAVDIPLKNLLPVAYYVFRSMTSDMSMDLAKLIDGLRRDARIKAISTKRRKK